MKKKTIFIGVILLAIIGYIGYNYVMAAPKDIKKVKADVSIIANELALEFTANKNEATSKYQEKVIEVTGTITNIEDNSITLDNKVTCGFENKVNFKKGQRLKIKGLFIGFDDMLFEEVKLDKCNVVK